MSAVRVLMIVEGGTAEPSAGHLVSAAFEVFEGDGPASNELDSMFRSAGYAERMCCATASLAESDQPESAPCLVLGIRFLSESATKPGSHLAKPGGTMPVIVITPDRCLSMILVVLSLAPAISIIRRSGFRTSQPHLWRKTHEQRLHHCKGPRTDLL